MASEACVGVIDSVALVGHVCGVDCRTLAGRGSSSWLYPGLPSWANVGRPCGAGGWRGWVVPRAESSSVSRTSVDARAYISGWVYCPPSLSAENAERMGHPLASWPIRGEGSSGPESDCLPYGFKVKGSGQECPLYTVSAKGWGTLPVGTLLTLEPLSKTFMRSTHKFHTQSLRLLYALHSIFRM